MAYITHQQLHERPGARELAQIASDEHQPMVPYELMELSLLAQDRSAYTPEQIESADNALSRIDDAVSDATGLIDGYLRKAGHAVPLVEVPRLVTVWCRAITRYSLHQHQRGLESDTPIVRDYKDALRLLQQVATGQLSLGIGDQVTEAGVGMPLIKKGRSKVRDALKDY